MDLSSFFFFFMQPPHPPLSLLSPHLGKLVKLLAVHDTRPRKVGVGRLKHFGRGRERGRAQRGQVGARVRRVDDEVRARHAQAVHVLGTAPVVVVDLEVADLKRGGEG